MVLTVLEKPWCGCWFWVGTEAYWLRSFPCDPERHCPGCVFIPGNGIGRHVCLSIPGFPLCRLSHISSAASETESPRRNIAKAVRRVFYRILVFYVRSIGSGF
jgi:amino acid transporter